MAQCALETYLRRERPVVDGRSAQAGEFGRARGSACSAAAYICILEGRRSPQFGLKNAPDAPVRRRSVFEFFQLRCRLKRGAMDPRPDAPAVVQPEAPSPQDAREDFLARERERKRESRKKIAEKKRLEKQR